MSADTYGRFYLHPQKQADDSFKDVIYVEIFIKGDKNTSFSRPMKEADKAAYPLAWKSFSENSPVIATGNPISVLPGIGPSQALQLQAVGIASVEDLVSLSEAALHNIQGARLLQQRAKAFLAAMSVKDDGNEEIEPPVDVDEMAGDNDVVPAEPKKRRGRPPKALEA